MTQASTPSTSIPSIAAPTAQSNTSSNSSVLPTAPAPVDITLPAANKTYATPSIWPLATGWWVIIVLLLTILGFALYKGYRYWKMKQQQTILLKTLSKLDNTLQHTHHPHEKSAALVQMNQLLRRLALMHFPRQQVASLTGQQWLAFLDKTGKTTAFSHGAGQVLANAPYTAQLPNTLDHQGLVKAIRQWLIHINRAYYQGGQQQRK